MLKYVMNFTEPHVNYKVDMNEFYVLKGKVIVLIFFRIIISFLTLYTFQKRKSEKKQVSLKYGQFCERK